MNQPGNVPVVRWNSPLAVRSEECHLVLAVSDSSLQCVVYHPEHDAVIWASRLDLEIGSQGIEMAASTIREEFRKSEVFRKTTLVLDTPVFTMIPVAFFLPERSASALAISHPGVTGMVLNQHVPLADVVVVFELPRSIQSAAEEVFPGIQFLHHAGTCVRLGLQAWAGRESLIVSVDENHMLLTLFREGELILCNGFPATRNEDVLYFIANAAVRGALDLERTPVFIAGHGWNSRGLQTTLETYCAILAAPELTVKLPTDRFSEAPDYFPSLGYLSCE